MSFVLENGFNGAQSLINILHVVGQALDRICDGLDLGGHAVGSVEKTLETAYHLAEHGGEALRNVLEIGWVPVVAHCDL